MKNIFLLFLIILLFKCSLAQLTFSKVFYDSPMVQGNSVIQTADNGYMIVGSQQIGGLVMKLDSAGNLVWKKYYSQLVATGYSGFFCIAATNDSSYMVAGAMSSSLDAHIFCMKIDTLGDTLWTRTLPTVDISQIFSVQQTYDHGYIMAGSYRETSAPYIRTGVVKLDSTGNLEWSEVITTPGYFNDHIAIKQTPDSGYAVWGTLVPPIGIGAYGYLIKIDPSGAIQWSKTYNSLTPEEMYGSSIEILNDGFISFLTADNGPYKGILMKIDFSGNVIWNKPYVLNVSGSGWYTTKIHQTSDGGFIITIGMDYGPGGSIWRTDSLGNFLWAKDFMMIPAEAIETHDNGYLILGNGYNNPRFSVIKTDSLGSGTNCVLASGTFAVADTLVAANFTPTLASLGSFAFSNTTINVPAISDTNSCLYPLSINTIKSDKQSLIVSPNPSDGNFTISLEKNFMQGKIEIFNILGDNIFEEDTFNETKKEIYLKNISDGVYFLKIFDGKNSYFRKFIVEGH